MSDEEVYDAEEVSPAEEWQHWYNQQDVFVRAVISEIVGRVVARGLLSGMLQIEVDLGASPDDPNRGLIVRLPRDTINREIASRFP